MSFGLKNAGTTYQHAIQLCFAHQLHRNDKPMSMTLLSRLKAKISSSLTWKKPSTASENFVRNSTQQNVSSVYPLENNSDLSSVIEESKLTQRRSMPSGPWMLRHYFDEYKLSVITDFPLADILHYRDATRRISKWAVELGAMEIKFKPKTAIISQALVDF